VKSILVTFDLVDGNAETYRRAFTELARLGLVVIAQNVQLPSTTVLGTWFEEHTTAQIRDILLFSLAAVQAPPKALAVAVFAEAAWWRRTE
jgi:hypothetical protein